MTTARTRSDAPIPSQFSTPFLELAYLLEQAAGIEHSLMASYLYATWSIKDRYAQVRGHVGPHSYEQHSTGGVGGLGNMARDHTMLDVCIEEMQHLGLVNRFMAALGLAPNFLPHVFPSTNDIYPFPLALLPLDRYVAATYTWMEAPGDAVTLREGDKAHNAYVRGLRKTIVQGAKKHHGVDIVIDPIQHVGSLYRKIIEVTEQVRQQPPSSIPADFPWNRWTEQLYELMLQGEVAHYAFFNGMYDGSAFGGDASIWKNPKAAAYPARPLKRGTAWRQPVGRGPGTVPMIDDPVALRLAWLADLHYWIILMLLDAAYRSADVYGTIVRKYQYKAIGNMTNALWSLGLDLAERGWGVPFDPLSTQIAWGRDEVTSLEVVRLMVLEARGVARGLDREGLLPQTYDLAVFEATLAGLDHALLAGE